LRQLKRNDKTSEELAQEKADLGYKDFSYDDF
jgi:hypothetical protein